MITEEEGQATYRALAEALPQLVWMATARGVITYSNPSWLRYTGLTAEQAAAGWPDAVHPDDRERGRQAWESAAASGETCHTEVRLRRADGEYRWHEITAVPVSWEQSDVAWLGTAIDIHERKLVDSALRTRVAQQSSVSRTGTLALQATSLQELFDATASELAEHLDVEYVEILELTPAGNELLLRAGAGWRAGTVGNARISSGRSPAGFTLLAGAPVIVRNLGAETRFDPPQLLIEHQVVSGVTTIVRAGARAWGVLGVHTSHERAFSEDDVHYLQSIANVLGQAVLRQESEDALRESEERARSVLETAVDSILVIDETGIIDSVNPAVERLFGYRPDELVGRNVNVLMRSPDDHEQHDGDIERYFETGVDAREITGRRKDGSLLPLHLSVTEMRLGGRRKFTGVLRDISAQKRIEEALRHSQQQLAIQVQQMRTLVDVAPVGIGIAHDPECRRIDGNDEFSRMLRVPPGANSSLTAFDGEQPTFHVYHNERELDPAELPMQVAARTGAKTEGQQLDVVFDDGEILHMYGMAAPLLDAEGNVTGAVGAFMDVTQRVKTQRREQILAAISRELTALSTDKERLFQLIADRLVDAIGDAASIRLAREDGTLESVADAHRDPEAREVARRIVEARPTRADEGPSARVFSTGELVFMPHVSLDELRQTLPEDYWPYVDRFGLSSAIFAPLSIEGNVIGVLTVTRSQSRRAYNEQDVSLVSAIAERASVALQVAMLYEEAQRTAEDLRIANNAKDEFLGLVSHELRTPITTIVGNAEILSRTNLHLDDADRAEAMHDIVEDGRRLSRIIDDLLVLARLDRGVQIEIEPVSLDLAIRRVAEEHARRFAHRQVRVIGEAPGPVLANEGYLEQIVRNLVSNAEKYSPTEQPIEITVSSDDHEATVRVLDRGNGVPPEERESIFSAFYRARATENEARGVGIGLSVCRRLVEAQGGRIWVAGRDGGGSEFGFTLPLAR